MKDWMTLNLGSDSIAFTMDGKVVIEDALKALGSLKDSSRFMEELLLSHPEIMEKCERFRMGDRPDRLVADGETWGEITELILERLVKNGRMA